MNGFGYDPYDAEWEDPNTGRTTYRPGQDDYCEACDGPITFNAAGVETCGCDAEEEK